jgi:ArsR family transcriptional regulator
MRLIVAYIKNILYEVRMDSDYQSQARVFKALCDETRLRVLEMLRGGEKCACKLVENLDCGQSGLSYHMKVLLESGIVTSRQEGKWTYYRICPEGASALVSLVQQLTTISDDPDQFGCCEK